MNNISYISNPLDIRVQSKSLDLDLDNILKSCGIRSRSSSENDNNEYKNDKEMQKKVINKDETNEMYCLESSNFPNIPFGSTPPDTNRIKELYIQYMSHIQLKNQMINTDNILNNKSSTNIDK
jgi:hypothetical protein